MKRIAAVLSATLLLILGLSPVATAAPALARLGLLYAPNHLCATKAGDGLFNQVYLNTCVTGGRADQYWTLYLYQPPDVYQIRNDDGTQTGRCLQVQDDSMKDGAGIRAEACNTAKYSQLWRVNVAQTPTFYQAVHSSKCLGYDGSFWAVQKTCTNDTKWSPVYF